MPNSKRVLLHAARKDRTAGLGVTGDLYDARHYDDYGTILIALDCMGYEPSAAIPVASRKQPH